MVSIGLLWGSESLTFDDKEFDSSSNECARICDHLDARIISERVGACGCGVLTIEIAMMEHRLT